MEMYKRDMWEFEKYYVMSFNVFLFVQFKYSLHILFAHFILDRYLELILL